MGALAFQLWVFAFVAFAGTTLLLVDPVVRLVVQLAFAVPVVAWALLRVRGPRDALDLAIIVALVAHVVVSLGSSDVRGGLEATGIATVYASTFWLARHVGSRVRIRQVGVAAIVMALMLWLVAVAITWGVEKVADSIAFGWPPRLDAHQPYVWGSVNTPPVLALLVVPFIAWMPDSLLRRATLVTWGLTTLIVVPFSVGRAAWVGMAVALFAAEALFGFPVVRRGVDAARHGSVVARAAVGALAAGAIGLVTLIGSRMDAVLAALDSRLRLWQQAIDLFAADPLTGSGPSTFAWARLTHVPDYVDRVAARVAHNVPLQTMADGGVVLSLAMLSIAVAWVALLIRRRDKLDIRRRLAAAVVVGYAGVGLFDDLSFLPAVVVVVVVLAAWSIPPADGPAPLPGSVHGSRGALLPAVLALSTAAALPGVLSIAVAYMETSTARRAVLDGDFDSALAGFRRATELHPSNALSWASVGLVEHRLGRDDLARDAYRMASELSPGDPRPWGALAALATDPADARALLTEAARRSNSPQFAYRLAQAQAAAGDLVAAARSMAIAVVIRPGLFAVVPGEWRTDVSAELPHAVMTVGSIAGRDPNEALWNAALAVGELYPDAPLPWQAMERVASGSLDDAQRLVDEALLGMPRDLRAQQAASMLARARCDRTAYERAEAAIDTLGREASDPDPGVAVRSPLQMELDIGDFQPLQDPAVPEVPQWPIGLVEVPDCDW